MPINPGDAGEHECLMPRQEIHNLRLGHSGLKEEIMATDKQQSGERSVHRVPSERFAPQNITDNLGLLADLAGTWRGKGFNLIARPDFHDKTDLYLQLNQTREHLKFDPIGSPIPNRGFGQDDIELFGLTYLQQISDAAKDGALHIEPGIWVTQPPTTFPPETAPAQGQLVARMGTIPHGNSLLAEGIAEPFTGPPVLTVPGTEYSFSLFPSFNSTPFAVPPTVPTPPGDRLQCRRIIGKAHRPNRAGDTVPPIRCQRSDRSHPGRSL